MEWCWDLYDEDYYGKSAQLNPRDSVSTWGAVIRGGSWSTGAHHCLVASRCGSNVDCGSQGIGFRIAQSVS